MAITPRSVPSIIAQNAIAEARATEDPGAFAGLDKRPVRAEGVTPGLPSEETTEAGGGAVLPSAAAPLPVYTIPMEALAEKRPSSLDDAVQHGWRVLTRSGTGAQLVDLSAVTGKPLAVRRGRSVDILTKAATLAALSSPDDIDYEPRLIDFGRLGLSALWLHSDTNPDFLFRLDGEPRKTSEVDFLDDATRRARQYLTRPDRKKDDPSGELGG